jgi:acyl-coenzyme A thioesterase PaaI-like protein
MESGASPGCIACGAANPIGLRLIFTHRGEGVEAEFTPLPWHEGYAALTHGGIIAMLLDEAMAHALLAKGIAGVTAKMNVRFCAPLAVGEAATVTGWLVNDRGRLAEAKAELRTVERTIATAEAVFAAQKRTEGSA